MTDSSEIVAALAKRLPSKSAFLTKAAASSTFERLNAALHDAYATKGTAPLGTADSGQAWFNFPAAGVDAMTVIGGKLTNASTAAAQTAGYAQKDLGAPVTRIGGRLTFGPSTTGNGTFAFPIFKSINTGAGVPDSNFHLVCGPTTATLGTFAGGVFTERRVWTYPALTQDGATVYTADATLDGNTWTILLPDGSIVSDTHADYGTTPGAFACFETYALVASTDSKTSAVEVWADTTSQDRKRSGITPGQLRIALAPLTPVGLKAVQVKTRAPVARETLTLTGPSQEVHADLRQTFTYPASGRVLVEFSTYTVVNAASWLLYCVATDAALTNQVIAQTPVGGDATVTGATGAFSGNVSIRGILTGAPGAATTLYFGAACPTGVAKVVGEQGYGYLAISTITPIL